MILSTGLYAQQVGDSGNHIMQAVMQYNEGKYAEASAILDDLISTHPTNDAAWYYRALCSLAQKDIDWAEECFKQAVELDPGNFWYRYRLAGLYAATSRAEHTSQMYEKLLEDFPKKSELYYDLVELYSAQREYDKALETLKEIETVFGMTEPIAIYRFNLLMQMQRQREAYESLEEYNAKYSSPYVLTTLAEHQLSMYNDSTALAYYDEALDISPDYAPALLGKAETYRMTRRYKEYFDVLETFVSNPSDVAKSKTDYLTAVAQRMDSKFLRTYMPQMDEIVSKTVEMHPSDTSSLSFAGLYYYSTDRNDKAEEMFRENASLHPENLSSVASYVEFLMYTDQWEKLSEEGVRAFESFPEETVFLEMACMGDFNLDRFDRVQDLCDRIIEKNPADSASTLRAWSTKGDAYHQAGQAKKSYKCYEKALQINPDYHYVLNNYAYYLSMEGKNLKKALTMSSKTIEAEPDNSTYLDTYGWILYLMGRPEEAVPHFKHAMLYGGKDSAVILDHYAEVLFALGEYDRAMVYWNQALRKQDKEIPDLKERVNKRKQQMKNQKK